MIFVVPIDLTQDITYVKLWVQRFRKDTMMVDPQIMASQIKLARIAKGLTQPELALAADVSIPVISRMENGKNVSRLNFFRVCKVLEIDPSTVNDVMITDRRK